MGLSACQGQLLFLTCRKIDNEYSLMDISDQEFQIMDTQMKVNDKYDQMRDQMVYSYTFGDGNTVTNISYSDMMGSCACFNGRDPVLITSAKNNKVILDDKYFVAMNSAGLNNNGKLENNAACFNQFVAQMTGDSATNWDEARSATASKQTSSSDANNTDNTSGKTYGQETINAAKFYYQIFQAAVTQGYEHDGSLNSENLNAKLSNGEYNIGGTSASNNVNVGKMQQTKLTDKTILDDIERRRNVELKELEYKEKKLERERTNIETEIAAIDTEIQSLQSMISSDIDRTFTYG